jgi:hypothetical protein
MPANAPRTLADQLRGWSDGQLSALLEARPDLATPAPHDSSQLAARVVVKASVLRALDALDALELAVLQAIVQDSDPAALVASAESVERGLDRLRTLALVWGLPDRPVIVVRDLLRMPPGPPADDVPALLDKLEAPARAILDHLANTRADGRWSGGAGPTADLVSLGLLVLIDERHVRMPWSVRLALDTVTGRALDEAPTLATSERGQAIVDRAAAGAAFELVRRTELLLDRWGTHPPAALKAGGLGVRELRVAANLLHVEPDVAALVIETAAAAGLLDQGMTDDVDAAWLPTEAYDAWLVASPAKRWTTLARAWLASPRLVSVIGSRIGDKTVNALSPDLPRSWLVGLRGDVLSELTELARERALAPGPGTASLVERLRWKRVAWPPASSRWLRSSPRWRSWGSPGSMRCRRSGGCSSPTRSHPTPWRRCCPRRSTTSSCRPTSPRSRRDRSSRSSPASCPWSPTSSLEAGRRFTGLRPRRCDARSTPAGPRPRCTTSSPRPRERRCRSH